MPLLNDLTSEFRQAATNIQKGATSQATQLKKNLTSQAQATGQKAITQTAQKASGVIQSGAQSIASKIGVKLPPPPTAKPSPTITAPTVKPSPIQAPAKPLDKAIQTVKENPKTVVSAIAGVAVVSALVWYFFIRGK